MSAAANSAYTPLECLLLFQSLVVYGTDDDVFIQISDLLNNTALVKEGPTYDAQRLSAESLRTQYLQLLNDELRAEEDAQEDGHQPGSKKRKLQSPPLPSLKDAQQHGDKLPLLVDRLYARYRDYMMRAIREDEERYAAIQQEIEEIERGEWDEKILREQQEDVEANKSAATPPEPPQPLEQTPKANGVAPVATTTSESKPVEVKPLEAPKQVPIPTKISPVPAPKPRIDARPEVLPSNSGPNSQAQPPVPSSPHVDVRQNGAKNIRSASEIQRTGSNGPPHHGTPIQQGPQAPWKWEPPYGPPQQYQPGGFPPQFSPQQYPPQGPFPPPPRGSFSGAQGFPPPYPHLPSSPSPLNSHAMQLPAQNASARSPAPTGMDALADAAGQQNRPGPASPTVYHGPPPPTNYQQYPPQSMHPSGNGQMQFQPYPQQYPGPPQQYQHFPSPQNQRAQYSPRPDLIASGTGQYNSPYNANQAPRGTKPPTNQVQRLSGSQPNTPLRRSLPQLITGSGTKWTPNPTPTTPGPNVEIQPPIVEPISPILTSAKPPKVPQSVKNSQQKLLSKKDAAMPEPPTPKAPGRRGGQRTRAGSTASSVLAGSRRSQSIISHADEHVDELSVDHDTPRRVKEEVATPMGVEDPDETTADELPRHSSRSDLSPRHAAKRKRLELLEANSSVEASPPTHVLWTRNFQKISASALDTITGHKSASTFALPVKEREAPGYKHIVLRPQDLKSIRTAINAGHRAATAAVPPDVPQAQTTVMLPISEDLVPPKGIINNAQLEREIMRMFANAIMFNPDPATRAGFGRGWRTMLSKGTGDGVGFAIDEDGIVKDTLAMFTDVRKVIKEMRKAEGGDEYPDDNEMDELAGDGEGSIAKRRRKM